MQCNLGARRRGIIRIGLRPAPAGPRQLARTYKQRQREGLGPLLPHCRVLCDLPTGPAFLSTCGLSGSCPTR